MPPIPEPAKTVEVKSEKPANIASKQRLGHDLLIKYAKRLGYNVTTKGTQVPFEERNDETTPNKDQLKVSSTASYTAADLITFARALRDMRQIPQEHKELIHSYEQSLEAHGIVSEINRNKATAQKEKTELSQYPSIGSKPVFDKKETVTTKSVARPSGPVLRPQGPKSNQMELFPEPELQGPEEAPEREVTTTSKKLLGYAHAPGEPTPLGVHLRDKATGDYLFATVEGPNGQPLKGLARTKTGALIKDANGKPIFTEIRKPLIATEADWIPVMEAQGNTGAYQKSGNRKNGQPYDVMHYLQTYGPEAEAALKNNVTKRILGEGAKYSISSFPDKNPNPTQPLNQLNPDRTKTAQEREGPQGVENAPNDLKLATDISPFRSTDRPRPKQEIPFEEELKRLDPEERQKQANAKESTFAKDVLRNLHDAAPINERGNKVGGSAVFTPVGSPILPGRGFKYDLPLSVEPTIYEGEHLFNHKYGKRATLEEVHQAYVKNGDPEAKEIGKLVQTLEAARGPNTHIGQVGLDRAGGMQTPPSKIDFQNPDEAAAHRAYKSERTEMQSQKEYLASQRAKAMQNASVGGTARQGIASKNQLKYLTRIQKDYSKVAVAAGLTPQEIKENLAKFVTTSNSLADASGKGAPYSRTVPDIVRGGSVFKRNADNPNVRDEQGNIIKSHGRIAAKRGQPEFAESGEVDEKTGEREKVYADSKAVISKNISLVEEAVNELKLRKLKGTPDYRNKEIEMRDEGASMERRRGGLPFGGPSENTMLGSIHAKQPEKRGLAENQEAQAGKYIMDNIHNAVDKFIESKSPREETTKTGPNGRKMWSPPTEMQSGFRNGLTQKDLHEFVMNLAEKVSNQSRGNLSADRIIDVASKNPLVAEAIRWHAREHGSDKHTSIGGDRKKSQHREARNRDTTTREIARELMNADVKLEEIPKTPSKPFARKVVELMSQGKYAKERGLRPKDLRKTIEGPIPVRNNLTDQAPSRLPTETERVKAAEDEYLRRLESLFHGVMPTTVEQDYPRQRAQKLPAEPLPKGKVKVNVDKKKFKNKKLRGGIGKSPLHFFSLGQNAPGSSTV